MVSVGSFTKICSPGLRLGWLEASPGLLELISNGYIQSGGGVAPLQEAVMATLLNPLPESGTAEESPLDRHIARLRTSYASRASALVTAAAVVAMAVKVTSVSDATCPYRSFAPL